MSDEAKHPWDRLPDETYKAWHAFQHYLDRPSGDRSIRTAWLAHIVDCEVKSKKHNMNRPGAWWGLWSKKYGWVERATSYDDYVSAKLREKHASSLVHVYERHARRAKAIFEKACEKVMTMLDDPEFPAQSLPNLLRVAKDIELDALGHVPKTRHEIDQKVDHRMIQLNVVATENQEEGCIVEPTSSPKLLSSGESGSE